MRPSLKETLNFDDITTKRKFIAAVGTYRGMYRVEVMPTKKLRSMNQHRFYFASVVTPFARYLSDQDYDVTSSDQAHEILKSRFLTVDVVNKVTGEVICQRVRSSTELTTEEFTDFVERARAWLQDFFGIITEDPTPSYARAI